MRAHPWRSIQSPGKGPPDLCPVRLMSPPCCGGGARSSSARVPGPDASMPSGSRCVRGPLRCPASKAGRFGGAEVRRFSKSSGGPFARRTAAASRAAMASWLARVSQAPPPARVPLATPAPAVKRQPVLRDKATHSLAICVAQSSSCSSSGRGRLGGATSRPGHVQT